MIRGSWRRHDTGWRIRSGAVRRHWRWGLAGQPCTGCDYLRRRDACGRGIGAAILGRQRRGHGRRRDRLIRLGGECIHRLIQGRWCRQCARRRLRGRRARGCLRQRCDRGCHRDRGVDRCRRRRHRGRRFRVGPADICLRWRQGRGLHCRRARRRWHLWRTGGRLSNRPVPRGQHKGRVGRCFPQRIRWRRVRGTDRRATLDCRPHCRRPAKVGDRKAAEHRGRHARNKHRAKQRAIIHVLGSAASGCLRPRSPRPPP